MRGQMTSGGRWAVPGDHERRLSTPRLGSVCARRSLWQARRPASSFRLQVSSARRARPPVPTWVRVGVSCSGVHAEDHEDRAQPPLANLFACAHVLSGNPRWRMPSDKACTSGRRRQ